MNWICIDDNYSSTVFSHILWSTEFTVQKCFSLFLISYYFIIFTMSSTFFKKWVGIGDFWWWFLLLLLLLVSGFFGLYCITLCIYIFMMYICKKWYKHTHLCSHLNTRVTDRWIGLSVVCCVFQCSCRRAVTSACGSTCWPRGRGSAGWRGRPRWPESSCRSWSASWCSAPARSSDAADTLK